MIPKVSAMQRSKCGLYWPSKAAKEQHEKAHKLGLDDAKEEPENTSDVMPTFSMKQHLFYPFEKIWVINTRSKAKRVRKDWDLEMFPLALIFYL